MTLRVASLCAGYGGLERGLSLAGVEHELVWWAEIDPAACTVMAAHTDAPNYGDILELRNPPPVDLVTAGFPCPPASKNGKRLGVHDERWLFDDVCRVARSAGARWLFVENVEGILSVNEGDAMGWVCAALAAAGFVRWEWLVNRASDVGACHQRERWFCLAAVADADCSGLEGRGAVPECGDQRVPVSGGVDVRFGRFGPAVAHWGGSSDGQPQLPWTSGAD